MTTQASSLLGASVDASVGIIGCGWLGTALAHQLQAQGMEVLATRSSKDNAEQLISQGINTEVLSLPTEQKLLNRHSIFKQQCLVIAITPQFRQGRVDYADKVQQLVLAAIENSSVEQIILLSSTAIYNGLSGLVDEDMPLDLSADKVPLLNQAEQAVVNFNKANQGTNALGYVLRLAGLVGPSRHPGKFLLNGRMLKSPETIVNLIHQQDAIGLIQGLLKSDIAGGIFNGVSPTQVTKKEYYQAAASALDLAEPTFEDSMSVLVCEPKIVSGVKTQSALSYRFVYADLLHWLGDAG